MAGAHTSRRPPPCWRSKPVKRGRSVTRCPRRRLCSRQRRRSTRVAPCCEVWWLRSREDSHRAVIPLAAAPLRGRHHHRQTLRRRAVFGVCLHPSSSSSGRATAPCPTARRRRFLTALTARRRGCRSRSTPASPHRHVTRHTLLRHPSRPVTSLSSSRVPSVRAPQTAYDVTRDDALFPSGWRQLWCSSFPVR